MCRYSCIFISKLTFLESVTLLLRRFCNVRSNNVQHDIQSNTYEFLSIFSDPGILDHAYLSLFDLIYRNIFINTTLPILNYPVIEKISWALLRNLWLSFSSIPNIEINNFFSLFRLLFLIITNIYLIIMM
jgi:hypothetical protein